MLSIIGNLGAAVLVAAALGFCIYKAIYRLATMDAAAAVNAGTEAEIEEERKRAEAVRADPGDIDNWH